jgi:hypothetical protein
MFANVSLKGTPLGFAVKSCQNSQNIPSWFFFFFKKNKFIKIFKNSGMDIFANSIKFWPTSKS